MKEDKELIIDCINDVFGSIVGEVEVRNDLIATFKIDGTFSSSEVYELVKWLEIEDCNIRIFDYEVQSIMGKIISLLKIRIWFGK